MKYKNVEWNVIVNEWTQYVKSTMHACYFFLNQIPTQTFFSFFVPIFFGCVYKYLNLNTFFIFPFFFFFSEQFLFSNRACDVEEEREKKLDITRPQTSKHTQKERGKKKVNVGEMMLAGKKGKLSPGGS